MIDAPYPDDIPESRLLRRIAVAAGIAVIASGVLVLLGWITDNDRLRSVVPGFIMMLPMSAALFVAGGAALCLIAVRHRVAAAHRPGQVLAALVMLVGATMFMQRLGGWDWPINRLLFGAELTRYPYRPVGLMAVNSGASFTLLGAALLLRTRDGGRAQAVADAMTGLALLIASAALVGYLYGVQAMYALDRYAGMALPTAISFALFGIGVMVSGHSHGVVRYTMGSDAGALLARRMLLPALAVPLVLGWAQIIARSRSLVSRETGIALFVVLVGAITVFLILRSAAALRGTDRERQRALWDAEHARAVADAARERAEAAQLHAEAANQSKSEFLRMMSHELRTPLNAIRGYVELIEAELRGPVTAEQRLDLSRIRQSEAHLLGLIEDILNFTHAERGHLRIEPTSVAVADAIEMARVLVTPRLTERGLELDTTAVDQRLLVRADPERLSQVLVNLIGNAIKFCDPGCSISLSTSTETDRVAITVRDDGPGIPESKLETIFEPFVQLDTAHTRAASGIGLGLAIARQLARAMGGDVTAQSELGAGSAFTVHLPRAAAIEMGSDSTVTGGPLTA